MIHAPAPVLTYATPLVTKLHTSVPLNNYHTSYSSNYKFAAPAQNSYLPPKVTHKVTVQPSIAYSAGSNYGSSHSEGSFSSQSIALDTGYSYPVPQKKLEISQHIVKPDVHHSISYAHAPQIQILAPKVYAPAITKVAPIQIHSNALSNGYSNYDSGSSYSSGSLGYSGGSSGYSSAAITGLSTGYSGSYSSNSYESAGGFAGGSSGYSSGSNGFSAASAGSGHLGGSYSLSSGGNIGQGLSYAAPTAVGGGYGAVKTSFVTPVVKSEHQAEHKPIKIKHSEYYVSRYLL